MHVESKLYDNSNTEFRKKYNWMRTVLGGIIFALNAQTWL